MRTSQIISIENPAELKLSLLQWAQQFREIVFLDSNKYPQKYSSYDCMLAVDAFTSVKTDHHNAFDDLKQYQQITKDWLFGYLSYDLKNDTEALQSQNHDGLEFPDLYFFQPKKLFLLKDNQLEMHYLNVCDDEMESDLSEIAAINLAPCTLHLVPEERHHVKSTGLPPLNLKYPAPSCHPEPVEGQNPITPRISKEKYLNAARLMLDHIHRGDIYEANFCMEFFAEDATIDPLQTYLKLNAISEPPFAAFFKNHNHFALCASPERYLRMQQNKVISQPIKGTARRSSDPDEDHTIQIELEKNQKERSENIMIVDLVRNDLSRTATKGSVEVEELCGAYAFRQVHHLISTVVSEVDPQISPVDIIKSTFPMGSMTGAPKISAMNIIEKLEETKRGLYSGALGYFTPEGDFDFNVVIRSILYNAEKKYVSFSVGSAITSLSEPELEYEECMLKAGAMREVLGCEEKA